MKNRPHFHTRTLKMTLQKEIHLLVDESQDVCRLVDELILLFENGRLDLIQSRLETLANERGGRLGGRRRHRRRGRRGCGYGGGRGTNSLLRIRRICAKSRGFQMAANVPFAFIWKGF